MLGALGAIDSLLTSLVADNVTRSFHDSEKELVGQGIGNLTAGFIGGLPGAGATVRTMANVSAGGRTPRSGIVHSMTLLILVLGFGMVVAYIPHAALAGILVKVGIDVIDWRYLRRVFRSPRVDLVLMVFVWLLTVLVDVVTAVVGIGMILASLVFVKESAEMQIESIRALSDPAHAQFFMAKEADLFRRCQGRLLIVHLSGLMRFGAANEMAWRFSSVATYDVLMVDLLDVPELDGSAALAPEEIIERATDAGKPAILVGLSLEVVRLLSRMGILDKFKDTNCYHSREDALQHAIDLVTQTL